MPDSQEEEAAAAAAANVADLTALTKSLGLTSKSVPGDGNCLFHSVGHYFKVAKKTIHAASALRTLTCDEMGEGKVGYETIWNGKLSDGTKGTTWAKYVDHMRGSVLSGELEMLAITNKFKVTFLLVRPGLNTIQIGQGGEGTIWLHLAKRHFDPLIANNDPATAVARRQHAKDIDKAYRWTSIAAMKKCGFFAVRGGGPNNGNSVGPPSSRSSAKSIPPTMRAPSSASSAGRSSVPPTLRPPSRPRSERSDTVPPTLRAPTILVGAPHLN